MRPIVKGLLLGILLLLFFSQKGIAAPTVVINEFAAVTAGTTADPDWVELYNLTSDPIDLTGWILRDSTETNKVNLSGLICPNSFRKFNFSNRLNNGGDTIRLFDGTGNPEDSVTYFSTTVPQHILGQSTGRVPDGALTWVVLTQPTPFDNECSPNITPTSTPTETPSSTPSPTVTSTMTPTATPTILPTATPTITATPTPSIAPRPRYFYNWWLNFWQKLNRIIPIFPL